MAEPDQTPLRKRVVPEAIRQLVPEETEAELAQGKPRLTMRPALVSFNFAAAVAPRKVVEPALAEACWAGLWLAHNFLDESHTISQRIDGPAGSFWHGIMHRRERDYDNAAYWFRRVGAHPIFEPLRAAAATLVLESAASHDPSARWLVGQRHWDAVGFVDLVRGVVDEGSPEISAIVRRIARREWGLLFDFCYAGAIET